MLVCLYGTDGAKRIFPGLSRAADEILFLIGLVLAWGNGLLDDFFQIRAG